MIQNAIQAAIALLKKSAQDLADAVSINGVPQWADEPATQDAHDEILIAADGLVSASTYITRIESEKRAHLARIAELESQLAAETGRLDFVLEEELVIFEFRETFQLRDALGDKPLPGIFNSPRAAIDAARELVKGVK